MNGNEDVPVEIEVEPEIFPFEDFYVDPFIDDFYDDSIDANTSNGRGNHYNNESSNGNESNLAIYKCTVCREMVGSGEELLQHVRTHTSMTSSHSNSKNQYKCSVCSRSFDNSRRLEIHEETQHEPPFRCRHCNSFHTVLKYYKLHLKIHQMQHYKQKNSSSSRVPDEFMSNQKNHSKKSGFKHFYTPPQGLLQQQHPKLAATVTSLAVQRKLSSNQGLLPPSSSSLSPLRCKYCNKLFAKFTTLRKHEMLHKLNGNNNHTNNLKNNPDVDLVEIKSEELEHHHLNANNKLSSSSALTLTPSLLSNLNKLANLKSSECTDGKKPAILININTNTPSDAMDEAKKSQEMPLNSNSGLMISSVSSVNKNYYETMERQRVASNATVFVQNGKKVVSLADLQCPICKKIVSQPFSLKVHLRTHTLEKPYSCPICKKSFSQSCNLKTHMNVHNKHQKYPTHHHQQQQQQQISNNQLACNICKKTFLKASSLNTHMITHTAKLYCYACSINFDDDAIMYSQHMQLMHNVTMTKDLISRAKANLQKSESLNQQQLQQRLQMVQMELQKNEQHNNDDEHRKEHEEEIEEQQPRLKEIFQVQSSSVENGQIPKLKITIKKEPMMMIKQEPKEDGNQSDSSSSSSSSSNSNSSNSSSSSSGSSSSSTSNNSKDERNDNNNH